MYFNAPDHLLEKFHRCEPCVVRNVGILSISLLRSCVCHLLVERIVPLEPVSSSVLVVNFGWFELSFKLNPSFLPVKYKENIYVGTI